MAKNKKSMIGFDPLAWLDEEAVGGDDGQVEPRQVEQKQKASPEAVSKKTLGKKSADKKTAARKTTASKTTGRKSSSGVKQIELLGQTLDETALLKGYELAADRLETIVEDFYGQLFSQYPEVQPLFARSDLSTQGKKLQSAIQLLVDYLHQPEALQLALQDLGRRHQAYGVLPEHYPLVVEQLLASFKKQLGRRWTKAINTAWQTLLDSVSAEMCNACDDTSVSEISSEAEVPAVDTVPLDKQTPIEPDESQTMPAESLLKLQSIQDISQSAALKTEMLSLLDSQQTIQIDASSVERIDGSALQLLCALFAQAENNGVSLQWLEPSDAFLQAAKYSGLTSVLNLQIQ